MLIKNKILNQNLPEELFSLISVVQRNGYAIMKTNVYAYLKIRKIYTFTIHRMHAVSLADSMVLYGHIRLVRREFYKKKMVFVK